VHEETKFGQRGFCVKRSRFHPLLFLPGFINQSLGVTLVPAISEANAQNNLRLINRRLNLAISMGVMLETSLHYYRVVKLSSFALDTTMVSKILGAGLAMGFFGRGLFTQLNALLPNLGIAINMLAGILISMVVYIVILGLLRVIHQKNIVRIPLIGRLLALMLPK